MSMAGDVIAHSGARSAKISAVVTRCGCGDPANIHHGAPCPRPRTIEDRGTVAYWHKNPLFRLAWRIGRIFRG